MTPDKHPPVDLGWNTTGYLYDFATGRRPKYLTYLPGFLADRLAPRYHVRSWHYPAGVTLATGRTASAATRRARRVIGSWQPRTHQAR